MRVYRLERKGWGVWSDGNAGCREDDGLWEQGCTVSRDSIESSKYRYGCDSIDKLIEYFGSDFARLLGMGFIVAEYTVRKNYVVFGYVKEPIELVFRRDKAERSIPVEDKSYIEKLFGIDTATIKTNTVDFDTTAVALF